MQIEEKMLLVDFVVSAVEAKAESPSKLEKCLRVTIGPLWDNGTVEISARFLRRIDEKNKTPTKHNPPRGICVRSSCRPTGQIDSLDYGVHNKPRLA
ncbi:hypothetical protein EVAR_72284_1 [Eumeta japonica]|uniref:Uncharacterized protein n=1 Tax=Eumeta variegata TaxID=151549 RepID=A0A4C1T8A3_EUMVA|nr:hypothetical protein EVAR_72284_1 [Eumeta japonica]